MANINGGYVSIDVTSSDLFNELDKALLTGKPILIYGDDVPYYADEVTYDSVGNTFDIVKGGQVINVASDGTITKTGYKATSNLYLLSFASSDTYVSVLTPVKTGLDNVVMNTDSSDYTVITLTDEQKAILLKALENSVKHFLNVTSDVQIVRSEKDNNSFTIETDGGSYDTSIAWNNDNLRIVTNANNSDIRIYEEQIV